MSVSRMHESFISFDGSKQQLQDALPKLISQGVKHIRLSDTLHRELLFDLIVNKSNILTQHGYFPSSYTGLEVALMNFLRYPNPTLEEINAFINLLPYFHYYRPDDPYQKAEEYPSGLIPFLLLGSQGIYPSGRSRATMRFFGEIPHERFPDSVIERIRVGEIVKINDLYLLPVSRYASGMKRGLYYSGSTEDEDQSIGFCGTFYYFEPWSDFILTVSTLIVVFNKAAAGLQLLFMLEGRDSMTSEIVNLLNRHKATPSSIGHDIAVELSSPGLLKFYYRRLAGPHNEFQDPIEIMADFILERGEGQNLMDENYRILDGVTLRYIGEPGRHDSLDQPICKLARYFNIDVLFLRHEMSDTRSLGEILDTRPREESISSLRRIK